MHSQNISSKVSFGSAKASEYLINQYLPLLYSLLDYDQINLHFALQSPIQNDGMRSWKGPIIIMNHPLPAWNFQVRIIKIMNHFNIMIFKY